MLVTWIVKTSKMDSAQRKGSLQENRMKDIFVKYDDRFVNFWQWCDTYFGVCSPSEFIETNTFWKLVLFLFLASWKQVTKANLLC
jgi:hypothetical protein